MQSEDFSTQELKEFYSFLSKISNFEKVSQIQSDSIIFILWGSILIISSVSETFLNLTTGSHSTIFIWITAIFFGVLLTYTIENQATFLSHKKLNLKDRSIVLSTILVIIAIFVANFFHLYYLLFPILSLIFFIFNFNPTLGYVKNNKEFIHSSITRLIPYSGLISSAVSILFLLIGTNLINQASTFTPFDYANYESILFAFIIGPVLIASGLLNNKKINEYNEKLSMQILKEN